MIACSWKHVLQVRMPVSRGLAILFAAVLTFISVPAASKGQALNCTGTSASGNPAAQEEIDKGVELYKNARYADAISHLQRATDLAPCMTKARSYLATAQAQDVVPALNTPENLKIAEQAIANFKLVLALDPHDVDSLKQVAGIYYSTKRLDEARDWQKKVLAEDPHDAEAAYTIGVIDWNQAHLNALNALEKVGLEDDGEGNAQAAPEVLALIKQQNADLVAEAIQYLAQALADRPNYDDAMAYINLVYRRKADIDYDNPGLRREDIETAKEWSRKAMLTRKDNQAQKLTQDDPSQP